MRWDLLPSSSTDINTHHGDNKSNPVHPLSLMSGVFPHSRDMVEKHDDSECEKKLGGQYAVHFPVKLLLRPDHYLRITSRDRYIRLFWDVFPQLSPTKVDKNLSFSKKSLSFSKNSLSFSENSLSLFKTMENFSKIP